MSNFKTFHDSFVDTAYSPEASIVLRYRNAFRFGATDESDTKFRKLLLKTSIREGVRIFPLISYKNVEIYIQDETSLMHTRTLKSIDGCLTTARCLEEGYLRVVFESGGNTGNALTAYGVRAGLETFLFLPEENVPLLNSKIFAHPRAHIFSVKQPGLVKAAAHYFETVNGFQHIPRTSWRIEASKFRGMFLVEHMAGGRHYDWLVQSISAGFGPIGIFWALQKYKNEIGNIPRFLGIQQEANCPMYQAWKTPGQEISPAKITSTGELLTRVMYDVNPHTYGTREDLIKLVHSTKGVLSTLNHPELKAFLARRFEGKSILDLLSANGLHIPPDVPEKTGIMALAGAFKAIDDRTIPSGARVLACLTSGMTDADGKTSPEQRITSEADFIGKYRFNDCEPMAMLLNRGKGNN